MIGKNKLVDCYNCKNQYDCDKTYLGCCTDGEEWTEEMCKSEFYEQTRVFVACKKAFSEFEKAYHEFWKTAKSEGSWRNTKLSFWREICLKYDEKDLLNCYGDIFFVDERHGNYCVGRRVLWNLELSKESYEICSEREFEDDGEYAWTNYEINVIK